MRIQWITAALLSAALVVACGDRGTDNTQNPQESQGTAVDVAPEGTAPAVSPAPADAPAVSSNRDSSSARLDDSAARATTGGRAPARAPTAARTDAASRPANEPAAERPARTPARPTVRVITVPAGTALPLELTTAVSTETATVEMPVTARLRRAVTIDGATVLPAGATVNGEVSEVDRPGRVQGRARLALRFTSVTFDGRREEIRSNPVTFEGEQTKGEDATKIGAGAGIGAIVGGIIGGGDGAAKGAAIGGAAGTGAVLATRGRDVALAPGADINATLATPVDVEVR
jgi:hypothetical protein